MKFPLEIFITSTLSSINYGFKTISAEFIEKDYFFSYRKVRENKRC